MSIPDRIPEQTVCLQKYRDKSTGKMETCHKKRNHLGRHKT